MPVSGRNWPAVSPLMVIGPTATRVRVITLWPSLASIRRTSRFFPSARTSSRIVDSPRLPTARTLLARTFPSASQIPSTSWLSTSRVGEPATTTR